MPQNVRVPAISRGRYRSSETLCSEIFRSYAARSHRAQKGALGLGSEVGVGLLVAEVGRQRSVLEEVVALGSSPVGVWIGRA